MTIAATINMNPSPEGGRRTNQLERCVKKNNEKNIEFLNNSLRDILIVFLNLVKNPLHLFR